MKAKFTGWLIAIIMRGVGLTLRWRVKDYSGVTEGLVERPLILAFWHNQIFGMTLFYKKFLRQRHATVLTSSSRDGDVLTAVVGQFGYDAIRGSSNKRSTAVLREIVTFLKEGNGDDIVITPDGPRGPAYKLQAGVIKVSQLTGVPVLPIRLRYSKAISLKTWDRFRIPWPFSRVDVVLEKLQSYPDLPDRQGVEEKRLGLENVLQSGT